MSKQQAEQSDSGVCSEAPRSRSPRPGQSTSRLAQQLSNHYDSEIGPEGLTKQKDTSAGACSNLAHGCHDTLSKSQSVQADTDSESYDDSSIAQPIPSPIAENEMLTPPIPELSEPTSDFEIVSENEAETDTDQRVPASSANQHRELEQTNVSITTKDLVKLMVGYGPGVAQIYWDQQPQAQDKPLKEKINFLKQEKSILEGSRTLKDIIITHKLNKEIEQCEREVKGCIQMFNEAMSIGHVDANNTSVLIVGPAGAGKTCMKHLIFGLPPPPVRTSTAAIEAPICAQIRNINREKIQVGDVDSWKVIETNDLMKLIVDTISSIGLMVPNLPQATVERLKQIVEAAANSAAIAESEMSPIEPAAATSTSVSPSLISSVVDNLLEVVVNAMSKTKGNTSPEAMEDATRVLGLNWIYFSDSGGQPHFYNLMPHFIHGISIVLITVRLCDRLDDQPTAFFYDDGESIGDPYQSPLTIEDTLKHLIRSMQSHSKKPKIMFIGTFLDKIDECSETLDEKNQKLYDLFSPECLEQLVFNDATMNKLLFTLNATSRSEQEEKIAQLIQTEIQLSPSSCLRVPILWYVLEVILEILSLKSGRKIISKQECLVVAEQLHFKPKELTAALTYFHKMHIFHYYPQILPDVIFTSPQVLLDKLTELIKEAYRLRKPSDSSSASQPETKLGGHRDFRDKGIITVALLNQKMFQQHYINNIFSPQDLLKILKKLLILTPFSMPIENDHTKATFFMPSLLDMLPSADLEKYRCFKQVEPLVISFPSGSPRSGVFCCLQVHLIKEQKWDLVHANGKPDIIAQNCVMLSHPTLACNVTLIDSFSCIEVHIAMESKLQNIQKALPQIREAILSGIRAANRALNYSTEQPHKTFFCVCHEKFSIAQSPKAEPSYPQHRHIGKLKEGNQLQCSVDQKKFFNLNERHTLWLGKMTLDVPASSVLNIDDHLLPVRTAIHRARSQWLDIGRELRVPEHDLTSIRSECNSEQKECLYQTLRKWIQNGEATIEKLLEALENEIIGYSDLAKELRALDPEKKKELGFQD